MAYKRQAVARHFGKGDETIRRWSIEFEKYLSTGANMGGRNRSVYTDEDMGVLTLVNLMYDKGNPTSEIHHRLSSGSVAKWQGELRTPKDEQTIELQRALEELKEAKKTIAVLEAKIGDYEAAQEKIDRLNQEIGALKYQLDSERKKRGQNE